MTSQDNVVSGTPIFGRVNRRTMLRTGGAALALGAVPGMAHTALGSQATPATGSSVDIDAIDQFTADALDAYGVPGASIAVIHDGQPLLVKGYGVREAGTDAAVDADTAFQLASNTKPMTAFVAGTLIDEGLIGWDTPVVEVLPELRLWDEYATLNVTLRDLLAHRSGLPAFSGDLLGHLGYDRAEMLRRLRFVRPASSFRDAAHYSNLGFFIAGEVIARLTGAPWEDAFRERFLQPTGMTRSGPSISEFPADGNVSANHGIIDGNVETVEPDDHGVHGAAGSAFSTANDLARWMQMLLDEGQAGGQQLIQPGRVREMLEPSMVAEATFAETPPIDEHAGFTFGLGWGNFHAYGHEIIEKGGALAGIRTVVCLVPSRNFGVAVTANMNLTFFPEAVRAFVLEQFLGAGETDTQEQIQQLSGIVDALFAVEPPPENPLPPSVPLENYAGVYESTLYGRFEVIAEGDSLRMEAGPADLPATLEHYSLNTFNWNEHKVTSAVEPATFVVGPDGIAVAFEMESLGRFDRVAGE